MRVFLVFCINGHVTSRTDTVHIQTFDDVMLLHVMLYIASYGPPSLPILPAVCTMTAITHQVKYVPRPSRYDRGMGISQQHY